MVADGRIRVILSCSLTCCVDSGGVVQPVVVGAHGRPHVIEHVQQLTQGMDVPETRDGDSD